MKRQIPDLRIRIKALAYEALCTRHEERRTVRVRVEDGQMSPHYELRLRYPRGYREPDGSWILGKGDDLYFHRTLDIRKEQRATLIAYGFLRGVPMAAIEPGGYQPDGGREQANWKRVRELAETYGGYGYTKAGLAQAWADIVVWRAVPALPREEKMAFRPRVTLSEKMVAFLRGGGAATLRDLAGRGGEGDTTIVAGAGGEG